MTADKSKSKKDSRVVWDTIKIYLKKEDDKSANFQNKNLEALNISGYNKHGLPRVIQKGIIKIVKVAHEVGGPRNVYRISDNLLGYSLDQILNFDYREAYTKAGRK